MAFNGIGGFATAVTVGIIVVTKFVGGAWISIFLIPVLVIIFLRIRGHYTQVGRELNLRGLPPSIKPFAPARVVIPIAGVHRGVMDAIAYARSISRNVTAVYIELEPGASEQVRETWERWWPDVPLVVLPSPYRSIVGPLLDFLDVTDREHGDGQEAAVIIPEFVPAHWWQALLHNQTAWLIKAALLYRRRRHGLTRVIIDVPYHLRR
jgi:hypothetical protein